MISIPFEVDVAHGLSRCHGNLVEHHVLGVPDDQPKDVLLGLAGADVDGFGNVGVLAEDVDPHVQLSLGDARLEGVVEVTRLHVFGDQVLLA